jgi:hypothetical protein
MPSEKKEAFVIRAILHTTEDKIIKPLIEKFVQLRSRIESFGNAVFTLTFYLAVEGLDEGESLPPHITLPRMASSALATEQ